MLKSTMLKEIQKRLPDDLIIVDETNFEFSEDEFVGILSWLKYFNEHYAINSKKILPDIQFPIISMRLRMDFGLYISKSDIEPLKGHHLIYLSDNFKHVLTGKKEKGSIKDIISTWKL